MEMMEMTEKELRRPCPALLALCLVGIMSLTAGNALADDVSPTPTPLWPHGAPGALGSEPADIPMIRLYQPDPEKANGAAVVVLPGGGYGMHAIDHEGQQVARWFNSIGVTAIVVTYRLGSRYHHPAPLQDALQGIRTLRAEAKELKIDPNRIGVIGFSAGGHLASTVATHFDEGDDKSDDPVARQSSRPNFCILGYPVISMKESFGHSGSKTNLLGENPDDELVEKLSTETQVRENSPPTFLFQTDEDTAVPAENAVAFYLALRQKKIPAEMHIYQQGPHGVGLAPGNPILSTWKEHLHAWLKANHFLSDKPLAEVSGNVTLNKAPLKWGTINFHAEDPNSPDVSGIVHNGAFHLSGSSRPNSGRYHVTVFSMGEFNTEPSISDAFEITENNTVETEVRAGKNQLDFAFERKS